MVVYNGYKGSDTRGHSCVGFRISVAQDGGPSYHPTNARIPSDNIANDSADNQSSATPTINHLANKGEWKTNFCMHLNPFHADGNISLMEVQFLTSAAAMKVKNFELHFFKKFFGGHTPLYRFEKKHKISQNDILPTNFPKFRKVRLPSLNVTKGMLVGLYIPIGNLRICSRTTSSVPAATFLYHPEPGPRQYTENNSLNVRFTAYKNTDHRGKTFPGYRLFFQMETHSQRPSDDVAALPPRPRRPNRAEPNTERNPSSGPSEQESSSAMHYLGLKPLPTSLNASWRSDYMMMDLPVKKAGIIDEIELWLGSVCMSNKFFLRVFEKLPGRNMFKQISYHPISINKMMDIISPKS